MSHSHSYFDMDRGREEERTSSVSRTLIAKLIGEIDRSFECVSMSDECMPKDTA